MPDFVVSAGSYLAGLPPWIWVAGGFLFVGLVGFVSILRAHRRTEEKFLFAAEFRQKFIQYANSEGNDGQVYHDMILSSHRMQSEMGPFGIWAKFRDPPLEYTNYGIILNGLPRIRRDLEDGRPYSRVGELIQMMDESLVRFLGVLKESHSEGQQQLRNPPAWLRKGVEQIVSIPLYLLLEFGLIGRATVSRIQRSIFFRLIAALMALLAVFASVIALLVDGNEALSIIRRYIGL